MNITIEKVSNGYLVTDKNGIKFIFGTLDEVMEWLLEHFEGRSLYLYGEYYGKVVVTRERPNYE